MAGWLRRLGFQLAIVALLVPIALPLVHRPATGLGMHESALAAAQGFAICSAEPARAGSEDQEAANRSGAPDSDSTASVCQICLWLQIANSLIAPTGSALYVPRGASTLTYLGTPAEPAPPRRSTGAQPRAPPPLA